MKFYKESAFKKETHIKFLLLSLFLILCFMISFTLGRYPVSPLELIKVLSSKIFFLKTTWPAEVETVIFQIRLPRVMAAVLIGSALSCAGATYQGLFQNPMVSPDLLGASAGAGFGAALAIFLGFSKFSISAFAFLFGLVTVFVVWIISSRVKTNPSLGLILTGIMVGSLFSAGLSFIKLVADPNNELPAITYWLMGSLAAIRLHDLFISAFPIFIGLIPLMFLRWKLNVMTMGEEEAKTMGVNTKFVRVIVIACATLVTAACVSVSGMIGWVGLVIPHFTRMIVGADFRVLIPASMLLGASFLLVVDNFSRLLATQEIPLGILTAFVGAPFFVYLILREGNRL
ncbi:FecCD family ABC transporter permease [Cytobacillus massiliigabonensis]|uniref:FecCD family ABC transporter permease n=1 Tax=Cytobacillus massiliigabonensis TaxID=1871011 RepID=UPI000C84EDCC|nr:iron ABC transporter permease [Cytobacillus massiliigabonensis]